MVKVDYIVIKENLPTPEFIRQYHKKLYCNIRFCQSEVPSHFTTLNAKEVRSNEEWLVERGRKMSMFMDGIEIYRLNE